MILCLFFILAAMSCKDEGYETGDGDLSFLKADFGFVLTNNEKKCYGAETDEGDNLIFSQPKEQGWATVPDSLYRALIYYKYNKEKNSKVDLWSLVQVFSVYPINHSKLREKRTDPLLFESAWLSGENKYLNLGLFVKTGVAGENDPKRTIGMISDTLLINPDGHNRHELTLFHSQNGVPEYYSSRLWMTVNLSDVNPEDTINLKINTYDGMKSYLIVAP